MRTYDRLYRFLSSYPDVTLSEEFKKKELETFEKYISDKAWSEEPAGKEGS